MIRHVFFLAAALLCSAAQAQFASSGGTDVTYSNLGIGSSIDTDIQLKVNGSLSRNGIFSISSLSTGYGVYGWSDAAAGRGVVGRSSAGKGVYGFSGSGQAIYGEATGSGAGVYGLSASGYAGHFAGKTLVTGPLEVGEGIDRAAIGSAHSSTLNWGTTYLGFNAYRSGSSWNLETDGGANGGSVIYGLVNGALCFSVLRSSGSSARTQTDAQVQDSIRMILHHDGKLQLGDIAPANDDYLLFVEKGIQTGKVKVDAAFADYVFDPGYDLLTLEEVESHIAQKGHLHNTPSAPELAAAGGFDLGEITVNQQEKIEELFLHLIALEKRVRELEAEKRSNPPTLELSNAQTPELSTPANP